MSQDELNYGTRLSGEEYDRAIVELYSNMPSIPSKEQRKEIRHQELNLAIDYRLGTDFPQDKREALWSVQKKLEKHRITLMFKYLFRRFFFKIFVKEAEGLANFVIDAYAEVLNEVELEQFFGKDQVYNPSLPIELNQLKK